MSTHPTSSSSPPGSEEPGTGSHTQVASSIRSNQSSFKKPKIAKKDSDESTPLLSRDPDREHADDEEEFGGSDGVSVASENQETIQKSRSKWRIPTIISIAVLTVLLIVILAFGFAMPAIAEEYAEQAAVFEPQDLSIENITKTGVVARVKGDFTLDPSRVERESTRNLGRFGTWIARAIEVRPSNVKVELPEQGNIILGKASVDPMVLSITAGYVNQLDFLVDLEPGEIDGIRRLADDWMQGRLSQLRVKGKADVGLKTGIFWLGTQSITKEVVFEGRSIPSMPKYNITKFNIHQVDLPEGGHGIAVDTTIVMVNEYPVSFSIPPLAFNILVPGCSPESAIKFADATTETINIEAKSDVVVHAQGLVKELPVSLIDVCPDSVKSPFDRLLDQYMNGAQTTLYVSGADRQPVDTPEWISQILRDIQVPVSFTGHAFKDLIRSFSMSDVHFSLPSPFAEPDSPEANPRISATINVVANLPEEMNFPVSVPRLRAAADVYYKGKKLGELDLKKWQDASSKQIDAIDGKLPAIIITTMVKDAPLNVTDSNVLSDIVNAMLFGSEAVVLEVSALVDIETCTALGTLVVRDIPASGKVPIKPVSGNDGLKQLSPKIKFLEIVETHATGFFLNILVNITNPTNYSASVPSIKVQLLANDTVLALVSTNKPVEVKPGKNRDISVGIDWDPAANSGLQGEAVAKELLSQYLSGWNTTFGIRLYEDSIPALPKIGRALSNLTIYLPAPKLTPPKRPDDPERDPDDGSGGPKFIDDATMHVVSSTATFTLLSPLPHTTLYITRVNATAFYNHTEQVGEIFYDLPFAVPPGATTSPKLPVDWSLGGVGYGAVWDAIGGTLKLDTKATVGVRIGKWEQEVWFIGKGIGAHVRI